MSWNATSWTATTRTGTTCTVTTRDVTTRTAKRWYVRNAVCLVLAAWLLAPLAWAQGEPSGEYGALDLGASVERTIAAAPTDADAGSLAYHTYVVSVPADVASVTVAVEGFGHDMDLAVKVGAPILDYDDVDLLDVSASPDPTARIDAPGAAVVYIDVLNLLPAEARYRLTVAPAETDVADAGGDAAAASRADEPTGAAANPLAAPPPAPSAHPYLGTFEGDGLRAVFEAAGGGYVGTLSLAGVEYVLEATSDGAGLAGRFQTDAGSFPFTALLQGDVLTIASDGARYTLRAVEPSGNPLAGNADGRMGAGAAASAGGASTAGEAAEERGSVLAVGTHGTLYEDDALAFIEALAFSLQHVGYAGIFTDAERQQMLQAIAGSFTTLAPEEQAVLSQAREVWNRVQENWPAAAEAEREQFVTGVFVLAFGEEAVRQATATGAGGAGAAQAGGGSECGDIDACISRYADPETLQDTMNAQGCWAAAGCSGYDPVVNDFSYDDPGGGY